MKAKYFDPLTDFGFKRIFGQEASKPLLPPAAQIRELSFKNTEHSGMSLADRKAIFGIYCESDKDDRFIVELQRSSRTSSRTGWCFI